MNRQKMKIKLEYDELFKILKAHFGINGSCGILYEKDESSLFTFYYYQEEKEADEWKPLEVDNLPPLKELLDELWEIQWYGNGKWRDIKKEMIPDVIRNLIGYHVKYRYRSKKKTVEEMAEEEAIKYYHDNTYTIERRLGYEDGFYDGYKAKEYEDRKLVLDRFK